jgi:general secretion pathway protein E/type IV pilus assembly protein PilB
VARDPSISTLSATDHSEASRALDEIVQQAAQIGASDVHLEPCQDRLRVRYRIDGVMNDQRPLAPALAAPIASRAKVLAKMDIAERRQPQDGTFKMLTRAGDLSLRVSTFPTSLGETVVLRLLVGSAFLPLEDLGIVEQQSAMLRSMVKRTGGLVLVTGPTGSGKTSTLYALLSEIDTIRLNVVTLEDPIEVQLPNITQGQVHPRAGFTFASGLRSILRQDPDVILVGEMRDQETAAIALQASLTGHLVLSTMHTNSTIATITRLIDLGIEPYIVANALVGVIAQRLVRTACAHCTVSGPVDERTRAEVGFELAPNLMTGVPQGCPRCHNSGYRGRRGVFEIVEINDTLRGLIKRKAELIEYKQTLAAMQIPTLRRMAVHEAVMGRTSIEEALRVT